MAFSNHRRVRARNTLDIVDGLNELVDQTRQCEGLDDIPVIEEWFDAMKVYFRRFSFSGRLSNLLVMAAASGGQLHVSGYPPGILRQALDRAVGSMKGCRLVDFQSQPDFNGEPRIVYEDWDFYCQGCLDGQAISNLSFGSTLAYFEPGFRGYVVDGDSANSHQRIELERMLNGRHDHPTHFGGFGINSTAFMVVGERSKSVEPPKPGLDWSYHGYWRPLRKHAPKTLDGPNIPLRQVQCLWRHYWRQFREAYLQLATCLWRAFNLMSGYIRLRGTRQALAKTLALQIFLGGNRRSFSSRAAHVCNMVEAVLRHRLCVNHRLPFQPEESNLRYLGLSNVRSACLA